MSTGVEDATKLEAHHGEVKFVGVAAAFIESTPFDKIQIDVGTQVNSNSNTIQRVTSSVSIYLSSRPITESVYLSVQSPLK